MLVWRGASAYLARPFVDYPRAVLGGGGTQETDFAQMSIGHAERRQLPCLGAETPARSCRRSYWVHQPWLVAPRGSLTANLVVRHSTPNSTARAPRPPSPEHARAHGSREAAATSQCRPARAKPVADLLLWPSRHRTDFQPSCARPWPRRQAPVSNPSIPCDVAGCAIRQMSWFRGKL